MDDPNLPKVVRIPPRMQNRFGTGDMLIPSPREIDALIRKTRRGSLLTVSEIRRILAEDHAASVTCPLTTGIFIRIAAEAAEEDARDGRQHVTPYWRVVKDDGSLNPKFPGGAASQSRKLREEGHRIAAGKGSKPPRVVIPSRDGS